MFTLCALFGLCAWRVRCVCASLRLTLASLVQPTSLITTTLAEIENSTVTAVDIIARGSGYAPGYGAPTVTFDPPEAKYGVTAEGFAQLTQTGRGLRVDVAQRGRGYRKPPVVTVADPPPASESRKMVIKAFLSKTDVGCVQRFQLDDEGEAGGSAVFLPLPPIHSPLFTSRVLLRRHSILAVVRTPSIVPAPIHSTLLTPRVLLPTGSGYPPNTTIPITISPPDDSNGSPAVAFLVMEYMIAGITVTNPGSGYAAENPINVRVSPPPATARFNLGDLNIVKSNQRLVQEMAQTAAETVRRRGGERTSTRRCSF